VIGRIVTQERPGTEGVHWINDVLEQVLDTMSTMEKPLRERWVAALNAGQYGLRRIDPDRDLDPTDERIPEERFTTKMQTYLTDEGEFSSIIVSIRALGEAPRPVRLTHLPGG
jgi:hypothetical protein